MTEWLFGARWQRARCHLAHAGFALIVVLGAIPGARQEVGALASGLVLHCLAYAAITFLLFTGCGSLTWRNAARTFLAVAAMGAIDEAVQLMLPYRVGSIADWLVDAGASLCMLGLLLAIAPRVRAGMARQPDAVRS